MLWMIIIILVATAFAAGEGFEAALGTFVFSSLFICLIFSAISSFPFADNIRSETKPLAGPGKLVSVNHNAELLFGSDTSTTLIKLSDVDIYAGSTNYIVTYHVSSKHFWLVSPFHWYPKYPSLHLQVPDIKNG